MNLQTLGLMELPTLENFKEFQEGKMKNVSTAI
jgi:hypothetical protein